MKIVSLFAGAGGLDLGFKNAGFDVVWANEYDREIWETYEKNHPGTTLDKRSITEIKSEEIPDCIGIIGGPPCQSWSEAGASRGIKDHRGQLFFDFIRILKEKKPLFFLAENVSGILFKRHNEAFQFLIELFEDAGFIVSKNLVNAKNYGVPQDRKRVIIVGYNKSCFDKPFELPPQNKKIPVLKDAIGDLPAEALPGIGKNHANGKNCGIANHEYLTGGFSSIFMSRNRVRSWDEPSFTIQAGGRHAPLHPKAPKMEAVEKDVRRFVAGKESLYRRLSIRECARVQTFPDTFTFYYNRIASGYKMVGNAVPVKLAEALALKIRDDLKIRGLA
ncbi:MAG: DNA cytosine methyltransferase [Chlorobi bacterium]|nr:DNA cytosine methyltransferase [Chlorobiota bacterium]